MGSLLRICVLDLTNNGMSFISTDHTFWYNTSCCRKLEFICVPKCASENLPSESKMKSAFPSLLDWYC